MQERERESKQESKNESLSLSERLTLTKGVREGLRKKSVAGGEATVGTMRVTIKFRIESESEA